MSDLENLINGERLSEYHANVKSAFVAKRDGYDLSQNDFTDALKEKLENAGESDFSGNYNDLTNTPTLDGKAIQGAMTTDEFGIAMKSDLPGNADASTPGLVRGDGATTETAGGIVSVKTGVYQRVDQMSDYVTDGDLDDALLPYAKSDEVDSKLNEIKANVSAAVTPKGSIAFSALPSPSKDVLGDMYDITDAFTTDARFIHSGQDMEPGTNVVCVETASGTYKWDTYSAFIDLSGYIPRDELSIAPPDFITGLFS